MAHHELPFLFEQLEDPYPMYEALRRSSPVLSLPELPGWVLTRHSDAVAVLGDRRFSVERQRAKFFQRTARSVGWATDTNGLSLTRSLLTTDPPDHTRVRGLVAKAFTPRAIERLRPRVEAITEELLDQATERGEMDMMADLASPLPILVIAEVLGLPGSDSDDLKRWSDDMAALLQLTPSPQAYSRFLRGSAELQAYFQDAFAERRRCPREDLLTQLVTARDGRDSLTETELLSTCALVLVAGHETTTNLLGNAVIALLNNPGERRRLLEDPSLLPLAVEEFLRYDAPVQRTVRVATEDCEIGGEKIAEGDLVLVLLAAANRDPEQFAAPDRLDLGRKDNNHLSFSYGVHHCLGARLARQEAEVVIGALLKRFPGFDGDTTKLTWKPEPVLRGVEALPLTLG